MSSLRRYLDEGGEDPKVALLRAGDAESPSPEAMQRTVAAMAVASAGVTAGASKVGTAALLKWPLLKWVGVALVVAGAGAYLAIGRHAPDTRAAVLPAPTAERAPAPTAEPTADPGSAAAATVDVPIASASAPPRAPTHPSARAPSAAPTGDSLTAEIATIDEASRAVAGGDGTGALRVLDRYQRDYPHGSFGPEATTLRIQALLLLGDRAGANALADRFLSQSPDSPHAARIRSLLGRTKQ